MDASQDQQHVMFIDHDQRRYYFVFASPADHICKTMRETGTFYEKGMLDALASAIGEGDCVIDVGANVGTHTVYFAGVMGCRVIAFEAVRETADLLRENVRINGLNDRVSIHEVGVGAAPSMASITRQSQGNTGATALSINAAGPIPILPLDSRLSDLPTVKLVKIDVEGMEPEVLIGAVALLRRDRPIVTCECIDKSSLERVKAILKPQGYVAADVFNATPTYVFLPAHAQQGPNVNAFIGESTMRSREESQRNWAGLRKSNRRLDEFSQELEKVSNRVAKTEQVEGRVTASIAELERDVSALSASLRGMPSRCDEIEMALATFRETQEATSMAQASRLDVSNQRQDAVEELIALLQSELATIENRLAAQDEGRRQLEELARQQGRDAADFLGEHVSRLTRQAKERESAIGSELRELRQRIVRADRRLDKLVNGRVLGGLRRVKRLLQPFGLFKDPPKDPATTTAVPSSPKHKQKPKPNVVSSSATVAAAAPDLPAPAASLPRPEKVRIAGVPYMARSAGNVSAHQTVIEGNPLLTVVMTSYNTGALIDAAVRSILEQTWSNLELIIVDDCSSDDTLERLQKFAEADSRVRIYCLGANRGTYWCKNFGITRSRGVAVTFMDSDDTSHPERLAQQFAALNRPGYAVSTCNHVRIDTEGNVIAVNGMTERVAYISQMVKRLVFDEIGYFDSIRTSADDEFLRRLKITYGVESHTNVKKVLYRALVREGSLTRDPENAINFLGTRTEGQSFLSPPRRHYAAMASRWHEFLKAKNLRPYVPFPVVRRPFPVFGKLRIGDGIYDDNIISAGLASFPARREKLEQTIASLLPQVDRIYVYLNQYDAIPDFLKHSRITVELGGTDRDLRDNGKFYFVEQAKAGYFFTVDDDIVYPADYVQRLIRGIEFYERKAIVGVHGTIFAKPIVKYFKGRTVYHFEHELRHDVVVNQLGTGTVAFHTSSIRPALTSFRSTGMADVWLALLAKAKNLPLIVLQRPAGWLRSIGLDESNLFREYRHDDSQQTRLIKSAMPWHEEVSSELARVLAERTQRYGPAYSELLPRPAPGTEPATAATERITEGEPDATSDVTATRSALPADAS